MKSKSRLFSCFCFFYLFIYKCAFFRVVKALKTAFSSPRRVKINLHTIFTLARRKNQLDKARERRKQRIKNRLKRKKADAFKFAPTLSGLFGFFLAFVIIFAPKKRLLNVYYSMAMRFEAGFSSARLGKFMDKTPFSYFAVMPFSSISPT